MSQLGRARGGASWAIGLGAPVLVGALLATADEPAQLRPLSVLLGVAVAVAVIGGSRAAVVGGVTAVTVGWWRFVPLERSFRIESAEEGWGLALYAATVAAVVILVSQLDRVRARTERERAAWEALFVETPVGLALVERDGTIERRNPHLEGLDGATEAMAPLVRAVAETGERVGPSAKTGDVAGRGEVHWAISAFPVDVGDRSMVGAAVRDTTTEVVRRRRSELLLAVSRAFNGAIDVEEAERAVAPMVAESLRARVAIFHVEGDVLRGTCSAGYDGDPWVDVEVPLDGDDPTSALRRELGDRTILWQAVTLPGRTTVAGAFSIAWDFDRVVTDDSRLLVETIAALAGASVARIGLVEDIAADRFRHAMEAMIDHVTIAHAVRDDDGRILDFEIDFVNDALIDGGGRGAEDLIGRRVCDLYPGWRAAGMFDRFAAVVETGVPIVEDRVPYADVLPDGTEISGHWTLQVVKVDDGYIAASRDVSEVVAAEEALAATERARERERIAVDLLQEVALPVELPIRPWLDVGAHYRPARQDTPIGGDWYDAFPLDDDRVCVLIADVSGHGPEAASFMVQVRNITRSVIAEVVDPGRALGRVNRVLFQLGQSGGPFVTVCLGVVDRTDGSFTWAVAGHPPPVRTSEGASVALDGPVGPPLVVFRGADWTATSVPLAPGDLVTLCTDGLIERRGEVIDRGVERLLAATAALGPTTAAEAADRLAAGVTDPADDLAVLCVRYLG